VLLGLVAVEPPEADVAAAVDCEADVAAGVLFEELPQAARSAAIAGALSPRATPRLRIERRLNRPFVTSSINF
jgi:hypothetical protein